MGQKQCDEMKRISRWCIVKSAIVIDDYGKEIDKLRFSKQAWIIDEDENRYQILFAGSDGKGKQRGWIPKRALCEIKPENYAMLTYENRTGKRIPVARRYKGKAEGFIKPGEQVAVRAVVGEWCITTKGWTLFKWLSKCLGDFFNENARDVCMAVLLQAVKDYQVAIAKLRMGRCYSADDYSKAFGVIDEITRWFNGRQYGMYFDDDGKEKLNWLNENLGVDKKWLKEKRRIYEEIRARGRVRRK